MVFLFIVLSRQPCAVGDLDAHLLRLICTDFLENIIENNFLKSLKLGNICIHSYILIKNIYIAKYSVEVLI